MRTTSWLIISAVAMTACTGEGLAPAPIEESNVSSDFVLDDPLEGIRLIMPDARERPLPDRPNTLARLQRGESFVEWAKPANAKADDLMIVIGGTVNEAPIIDMTTAESLRPVELFLALAAPRTAMPDSLRAHASDDDLRLLQDPQALDELRGSVAHRIADLHLRIREEAAASSPITPKAGTCTVTEVATARSVYGDGYTASSTCGDDFGADSTTRAYYYCNGGGDCDHALGTADGAVCGLVNPCDHVKGTVHSVIMRHNTNGNPVFVQSGHRIRGFAYNCQGDSGLEMHFRHGAGDWDFDIPVPVNQYAGAYFVGTGLLQERANAIDFIDDGKWAQGIPASGSGFEEVRYEIISNTGTDDRGIFCTDVQKSLTMSPGNPNSCGHGPVAWCNGTCAAGHFCFD